MKNTRSVLLSVITLIMFTCANAQVNIISTKLDYKNDTATWTMQFRVEEGFYVLAPDNISDDGNDFSMKILWTGIPGKLRPVNKTIWPPSNLHGQQSVFTEGDYEVKQVFAVVKSKQKSPVVLEGKISFQGCQEDRCYPPDEIEFRTRL